MHNVTSVAHGKRCCVSMLLPSSWPCVAVAVVVTDVAIMDVASAVLALKVSLLGVPSLKLCNVFF